MRDGDGKRQTVSSPQPQPDAGPIKPQPILVTRVLDVGPPLVPRQSPPARAPVAKPPPPPAAKPPPAPPAGSAASALGAVPPIGAPPSARTRPEAPDPMMEVGESESLWDSVEALIDDVDAGFGAIVEGGPHTVRDGASSPARSPSGGMSNARELFLELATTHVRHVRDFMIDVKDGQATAEWLTLCEPAMQSVRKMAEQLELKELVAALDGYLAALAAAAGLSGLAVSEEARKYLIAAYEPLIALLPAAFALDAVKSKREGIIVQSLLRQIPSVGKVTVDKLFSSGLSSLDALFSARPDEIAQTTGIDHDIAERITDRFARYKKELQSTTLDDERSGERTRLVELTGELERHQRAYELAEKDDDGAAKRKGRKARESTWLEIKVLLARLGEVDRVAAIDKMQYARRVAELKKLAKG
jgi:hypothetical protein